jgi:hypothetical protein
VHHVGGVAGLAIQFVGADQTKRALAQLPAAIQRKVLRLATAAAARPVAAMLKREARVASAASARKEGIGTTARSIATKVARKGYTEFVALQDESKRSSPAKVTATREVRRGRGRRARVEVRGMGERSLNARQRKARLDPKSNSSRKRVPSRYLHLFEAGSKRSRAAGFMRAAAQRTRTESRNAFVDKLDEGMKREFNKMAAKAA